MAKLLIIDDEPTVRMLIRLTFERQGYQVLEAMDGPAGLELAATEAPDIILLDLALPLMNGLEVAAQLPESTPVLLLTGLLPEPEPEATAQIRGYVEKPFSPASLVFRVQEVLDSAHASKPDRASAA